MRKQYIRFREQETGYVMQRLKYAESCSLVGVGSIGKSNLLHHIADRETIAYYLGAELAASTWIIIIDPYMLAPMDTNASTASRCWAGFELLMHRLYMAFYPFEILGNEAETFVNTYRALQDGNNSLHESMSLRYLERGLHLLMQKNVRIAFLFDELEELLQIMPVKFFQSLRALRDQYKQSLSYFTFSREPIQFITQRLKIDSLAIEPFVELFNDHLLFVGPYNQVDAYAMLERLAKRDNRSLSTQLSDYLVRISGGYAGLLRASYKALETLGDLPPTELTSDILATKLALRHAISSECEVIWKSLSAIEQDILLHVAQNKRLERIDSYETQMSMALLDRKGLLKTHPGISIEPSLFRLYLKR